MSRKTPRRHFLQHAGALAAGIFASNLAGCAGIVAGAGRKKTDIRIEQISFGYEEHLFRAPVGFAGAVVNRATMVTVKCSVRTGAGKMANGFGAMPFNHTFSFPSKTLSNETKNEAMKALANELAKVTGAYPKW